MSSRVGGESRSERVKRNGSRDTRVVPREFSRGPRGELSSLWMAVRKGTSWRDGEREKGERIGGKDERVKSNRRKNLRRGVYLLSFLFFRKNIQKNRLLWIFFPLSWSENSKFENLRRRKFTRNLKFSCIRDSNLTIKSIKWKIQLKKGVIWLDFYSRIENTTLETRLKL